MVDTTFYVLRIKPTDGRSEGWLYDDYGYIPVLKGDESLRWKHLEVKPNEYLPIVPLLSITRLDSTVALEIELL